MTSGGGSIGRELILTTERLQLRDFTEADWPDLYAIESDPEVARYQPFEPRTEAEALEYVRGTIAGAREEPRFTYDLAVVLHTSSTVVGRCGLQRAPAEPREAVVWFTLLRSLWGQGLIPEALRALVNFGFLELGLHRVWAECDPANRASYRVLEKIGMRREAHLIENTWVKGAWADSLMYAVLEREWLGVRPPR
jgi:RimJ/RimL family protein N-acetyltransferase